MASDEFLSRIDEHMARGNEHMARGNELMKQIRREFELNRRFHAEVMAEWKQERQITREVVRRNELAFQEGARAFREGGRAFREQIETLRELRADLRELGHEIRAQTQAIFTMLDRLDGGTGPATA